ncbi:ATP-grasp domain-containing protein [Congregibacter variabilis]|uniref:ATP-grasp domain-containing protein n=1 Tax=Congregibacter variabilis TaxID=3081200 RepID=A0ABZ0I0C2_9GAMM|nr:ATP-grasp domain-containing protein [Congregibacter sp. IMCC43200]
MKNVLVFPCGSEIGLEVNRSLAGSLHFRLFGGSSVDDHGRYVYENYIGDLPFADDENFAEQINAVVSRYDIDLIVPVHDAVVLRLAELRPVIDAIVVTSPLETCRIARSKTLTYEALAGVVQTPKIYESGAIEKFPVFLKPDVGQGSKGAAVANTLQEVDLRVDRQAGLLVCENLPGPEYTVDCFTDRRGKLRFASGRERVRITNGISVASREVDDVRFFETAAAINRTLEFRGGWFFQLKKRRDDELVLLEIATRTAGTMALFRVDGVNFVQLSLFDALGHDVEIIRNHLAVEIDRALFSRYKLNFDYSTLYVDFDDTLIVRSKVNSLLIALIYQVKSVAGKRVVLLTRHRKNVFETMDSYSISKDLFDTVVVLRDGERKSDHIKSVDSIFVDDSFAERLDVSKTVGIPVFSLDAVESLLTWHG